MIRRLAIGLVVAAALLAPAGAAEAAGTTTRVSVASGGAEGGGGIEPSISGDGRMVAFRASPSSFPVEPPPGVCASAYCADIFVRDRLIETTELVSISADGARSNGLSYFPDVSEDGRFVAFASDASNLVTGDTNSCPPAPSCMDVFVRDLVEDTTERISLTDTQEEGYGGSFDPRISADGRYVVFVSSASNLLPDDNNEVNDIFVRDRVAKTTERVSISSSGEEANGYSYWPVISGDGTRVAYTSVASNLVAGDSDTCHSIQGSCSDIFVRDLLADTTSIASVDSGGVHGNGHSMAASISANGRFVAFTSEANNLVPDDANGFDDVFVHDLETGATELGSVNGDGAQGNGPSCGQLGAGAWPCIDMSDDGRFIAFQSLASNLGATPTCTPVYDTLYCFQIYVRDRQLGTTNRVSISNNGTDGVGESVWPSVSSDGQKVAFMSNASNLVADDTNDTYDVFVHESGDTDSDGVPDVSDNCPTVANADQTDANGNLHGDDCEAAGSGNVDCSPPPSGVAAVDALKVLRHVASLPVLQSEPCLDIGEPRLPPAADWMMGDVDCSGAVTAVDALKILRAVAGLPASKPEECPEIKPP